MPTGRHLLPILEHRFKEAAARIQLASTSIDDYQAYIGHEAEQAVRDLLQAILPPAVGLGTGMVVASDGQQSRQLDIVVYEKHKPVFRMPGGVCYFPVEGVLMAVEVKSAAADREKVVTALNNIASLKACRRWADDPYNRHGDALRFGSFPFGIVVVGRSMSPEGVVGAITSRLRTWEQYEWPAQVPDLYVSLSTAEAEAQSGWVLAYYEQSHPCFEGIVSPHPHGARELVLDRGDPGQPLKWLHRLIFNIDLLYRTAHEAVVDLKVPLQQYLGLPSKMPIAARFPLGGYAYAHEQTQSGRYRRPRRQSEDEEEEQLMWLWTNYAYHEAGHCMMAALLAEYPEAVWINGGHDGNRSPTNATVGPALEDERERALYMAAGPVVGSWSPDYSLILGALQNGQDFIEVSGLPSSAEGRTPDGLNFIRGVEQETDRLLREFERAVIALAEALVAEKELARERIAEVIEGALGPDWRDTRAVAEHEDEET